jgi:hypothetical protein
MTAKARPRTIDHWAAYALIALVVLMGVFVVYTAWQQKENADARHDLVAQINQQHDALVCVAEVDRQLQVGVANILIAPRTGATPDDGDLQRLETLSVETRAAERLCVSGTPRPNAPPGTGPTR